MITIKSGSYNREEIRLLGELFAEMERTLLTNYCQENRCNICKYRRICEAIHSANEYINNK